MIKLLILPALMDKSRAEVFGGSKLYCVLENGSIVLDSEQSNSDKRIQIQAFIHVPTPATECGAALTMDEMPGFGSRGELVTYSVELKQVSVAATPAD